MDNVNTVIGKLREAKDIAIDLADKEQDREIQKKLYLEVDRITEFLNDFSKRAFAENFYVPKADGPSSFFNPQNES